MRLPYDVCRCLDASCPNANRCARFLERNNGGPRTPYSRELRTAYADEDGNCTMLIEVKDGTPETPH